MVKRFEITKSRVVRLIISELLFLMIPIVLYCILYCDISHLDILLILYAFHSFVYIPPVLLFFQYYKDNKKCVYEFQNNKLIYKNPENTTTEVFFEDIQKIISVDSVHFEKNGWRMVPSNDYHYIIIELKSGKEMIITSLLYKNAKDILRMFPDRILYYRHPKLFAWLNDRWNLYI